MTARRAVAFLVLASACARHASTTPESNDAQAPAQKTDPAAAPSPPRELTNHPWIVELFDETDAGKPSLGFVTVPLGAREPRPIMVALHGGGDRPEWACGEWRGIANAYPFVVCPRGPGSVKYGLSWSHPADTKPRLTRALEATRKLFADWIHEGPMVLVGFSRGASQAAQLAQESPSTYPRVALSESAYDPETVMSFAGSWVKGGGQRVLFSCTTVGCEGAYRNAARNVQKRGAHARLNVAGTNQHGIWDTVVQSVSRDWPWLVEGLDGWQGYAPAEPKEPLPGRTERFE